MKELEGRGREEAPGIGSPWHWCPVPWKQTLLHSPPVLKPVVVRDVVRVGSTPSRGGLSPWDVGRGEGAGEGGRVSGDGRVNVGVCVGESVLVWACQCVCLLAVAGATPSHVPSAISSGAVW